MSRGLMVWLVLLGVAAQAWSGDVDGDGVDDTIDVCGNTPPGTVVDAQGRPLGDVDRDCDADLHDYTLLQQGFTGSLAPPGTVIDTVTVGNPGNAGELSGDSDPRICGAVDYTYKMGRFEVTAGQYVEFLNAVAADDPYGLYHPDMADTTSAGGGYGCNIQRSGSPGDWRYSVAGDWAARPVNFVSWGDAARFCNWLHNGRPRGSQNLSTTEDGSYYLNGASTNSELLAVTREPDATWVIPSEDEWYKAAYHCNDGVTGNYWDYPTGSNTPPTSEAPPGTDMTNGSSNYDGGDYAIGNPYYRTEVGAYNAKPSDSPYGTFDQGGNVWEWNEAVIGTKRGLRGGSFGDLGDSAYYQHAMFRWSGFAPTAEDDFLGFRVAEAN